MDYLKVLPKTPPRGMKTQLLKTMRWKQVIGYYYAKDRKTGKLKPTRAECWCTTCGRTFAGDILPGDTPGGYPKLRVGGQVSGPGVWIECPKCGCTAPAAYKKRLTQHPIRTKKYPWTVKRAGRSIIFICWEVELKTGWKKYDLYHVPRNAYIITPEGKMLRATTGERYGWSTGSPMVYSYEWRMLPKCEIADDCMGWLMGRRPGMFESTALENAKLETILTNGITLELLAYIRLYLRHPNIENLVMTCPEITRALLLRYEQSTHPGGKLANVAWLNWKAVRPHEMLRMEKDTMKALEAAGGVEIGKALTLQEAVGRGVRIGNPDRVRQHMDALGEGWVLEHLIRQGWAKETGQTLEKITQYIAGYESKTEGRRRARVKYDVLDYWKDAKRAGFDITNATVAMPKDLYAAQARATSAIQYEENQKEREKFEKMTKALAPLAWHWRGLCIRAAENPGELVLEGKKLAHCVGGYSKAHCAGRCIFFIRHEEAPAESFYTLQLDTKTGRVIQNRGYMNCARTAEVQAFETKWLRAVVKPWIDSRKRHTTAQAAEACAA